MVLGGLVGVRGCAVFGQGGGRSFKLVVQVGTGDRGEVGVAKSRDVES